MATASLVLAVIALFLSLMTAGFGVWLQWQMYVKSSDQLASASETLAKLEGVALQLRDTQQGQFQQVLDAALKERSQEAETASSELDSVETRISQLETQQPELSGILSAMREALGNVQDSLVKLQQPAVRIGEGTSVAPDGSRAIRPPESWKLAETPEP